MRRSAAAGRNGLAALLYLAALLFVAKAAADASGAASIETMSRKLADATPKVKEAALEEDYELADLSVRAQAAEEEEEAEREIGRKLSSAGGDLTGADRRLLDGYYEKPYYSYKPPYYKKPYYKKPYYKRSYYKKPYYKKPYYAPPPPPEYYKPKPKYYAPPPPKYYKPTWKDGGDGGDR